MTILEFQTRYSQKKWKETNGTLVEFTPLSAKTTTGTVYTTAVSLPMLGSEYRLRQSGDQLFIGWRDTEFLFSPLNNGFQLISGNTVTYEFAASI